MNLMMFYVLVMHKTFRLFSLIHLRVYILELCCFIHPTRIYFSHKMQIHAQILHLPATYHECLVSLVKHWLKISSSSSSSLFNVTIFSELF